MSQQFDERHAWQLNPAEEQQSKPEHSGLLGPENAPLTAFVSLQEMMQVTFTRETWSGMGPWLLLGGKESVTTQPDSTYGSGVWQALQTILDWKVSGSQVTRALVGSENVVGSRENPTKFLLAIQNILNRPARRTQPSNSAWIDSENWTQPTETLPDCYYESGYDLPGLSPIEYFVMHFALNLQGSNFDFSVYDRQNDLAKTFKQTLAILRMMFAHPVAGGRRKIILKEYYGKFKELVFYDAAAQGIINVGFFPGDLRDEWFTATNWREATTQPIAEHPVTGKLGINAPLKNFTEPLKLQLNPEKYSDWAHHAIRSLRVITTHKLSSAAFDLESFLAKKPSFETENWSFITAIGVLSNLLISFFENPDLTLELLEKISWFGPEAAAKKALLLDLATTLKENPAGLNAKLQSLTQQNPEFSAFAAQLTQAENGLWQKEPSTETAAANPLSLSSLGHLAPLLLAFSPLTLEQLVALIPQPENREKITMVVSGSVARDASLPAHQVLDGLGLRRTQMGADAADAMWEIANTKHLECTREMLQGNNAAAIASAGSAAQMRRESQAMYALDVPPADKEKLAQILAPTQVSEI